METIENSRQSATIPILTYPSIFIKDNLTSWETFEEQTKECHRQLDLADTEFASIKKVFDLDSNKSVYETHKATGASFRSTIEALFKLVNDANNTIQCKYFGIFHYIQYVNAQHLKNRTSYK